MSFPVAKVIDANGMDVSEAGQAALKILAGAAKKEDAKVRVVARTSSAQPPKELRSLFHTAGEMRTVRAARVMSALEEAGLPPGARSGSWARPTSRRRAGAGQEGRGRAAARAPRAAGGAGVTTSGRSDAGSRATRILIGLVICGAAAPARAYDFSVDVRTIGQGYQVRGFAPDGSNELLSRRRLTQYLDLNVFDIGPGDWHGDDGGRNVFYVDASLRFDADFGGYLLGAPTGVNAIRELNQNELDILYAFLGGRNVGGHVDFQLGRQIHFDLIDFYAFDGADVLFHATRDCSAWRRSPGPRCGATLPLSSPIYELDGTSAGSRNPATRPAQNSEMAPMAGAALVAGTPRRVARWFLVGAAVVPRDLVGHRRPAAGRAGRAASTKRSCRSPRRAAWRNRIFLSGGVRYNVLFDELDDEQLALRVRLTPRQWLTLEHDFLAPTFDGDSIWNIFSTGAYRDLRASYEIGLPARREGLRARLRPLLPGDHRRGRAAGTPYAGQDVGAEAPGGRFAAGGSLGAAWRNARGMLRADGYWDDGYGGRKVGVDATTRVRVRAPLELEGRLTGYSWRNDLQPTPNSSGVVFGAQAGGRFQLGRGVRLHLLVEDNVGTYYESQFRGLAMLELDAGL